jgi:hypothetical protein
MQTRIQVVFDAAEPEKLAEFWELDAELERLLALGARPADVGQGRTENWHVLADPEGNEFCLLHTRLQPL